MPKPPTSPPPPAVLCLLRHGDAGDPLEDPAREDARGLSPKGRKQARRAGRALAALGLSPGEVWSSPLARARETAERAVEAAGGGIPVLATGDLLPDAAPERVAAALRSATPSDVLAARWLVGHEPHLSRLLGLLLGMRPEALHLGKGAVAVLEVAPEGPRAGAACLLGLYGADAIKALRDR